MLYIFVFVVNETKYMKTHCLFQIRRMTSMKDVSKYDEESFTGNEIPTGGTVNRTIVLY